MSKNILVLSGSPRKGANTDRLVDAFLKGAEGKNVTLFRVADLTIGGCRGCGYCFTHDHTCVQQDDMPQILDALKNADAIALASPVYYFGLTGQLKTAIDRFYALLGSIPVKRAALLLTCGNPDVKVADATIAHFRAMSAFLGWEDAGHVVIPGLHAPDEINGSALLADAERLGREI
ncbi:MAG: flavodoxin family protein [Oscillospiraceae bacterium]|jgi:multimeric flavodoxin WrbA|nr:flavodoxin family protein [Oscillospiraceae bacterium]